MTEPTVSVVVPTKDVGRTLKRCLRSIRSQSFPGVELVVVDNFSTDDTFEVAEALADIAVQAGPERSAQRNLGIELATGDYVLWIDADMVLTPHVVEDAVREAERSGGHCRVHPRADRRYWVLDGVSCPRAPVLRRCRAHRGPPPDPSLVVRRARRLRAGRRGAGGRRPEDAAVAGGATHAAHRHGDPARRGAPDVADSSFGSAITTASPFRPTTGRSPVRSRHRAGPRSWPSAATSRPSSAARCTPRR